MAKHGGVRAGSGRKVDSLTVRSRESAKRIAAEGITPLDVMVQNMRHFFHLAESAEQAITELGAEALAEMSPAEQFKFLLAEVKKAAGLRSIAQDCARDAAPYIHPRLAAIDHTGEVTVSTVARVPDVSKDTDAWRRQHVPEQDKTLQ